MDRDLITRFVLCSALLAVFLVASFTHFHVNVVGPVAVIGVAVVMFWPRHADDAVEEQVG
ncbi:hypothetical protein [Corynebacterium sp. UBA2622]|uniref:hypothetical protein n=1 Tax=Corynebacterium sp. UBA2622 TaxID=1946393 RepID=UPI0025C5741A|nr:hypothetical protein [Corynebacterium sp. UBA2622]